MLNYKIFLNNSSKKYILLLHCICGDMNIFKIQINELKKRYNVILIDLPYHGNSTKYTKELNFFNISNDIISILNKNNIYKVTIIGLSLGSCIANYLCYYYKDRIEKVIFASVANGLANSFLIILFNIFTKINILLPSFVYLKLFIYCIIPQQENKHFRETFYKNAKKMGDKNLRNWLKLLSIHFYNYKKYMAKYCNDLNIEKLFLMGEKDYIFKKCVKNKVNVNTYNSVTSIPSYSHMLNIDKSLNFSKLCIQFIENGSTTV